MQKIEIIKEKHFVECLNIISELSEIQNANDLVLKKELVNQLQEKIGFLKILSETDFEFSLYNIENEEHQIEEKNSEAEFIDEEIISEEDFQEESFSEEEFLEVAENKEEILNEEIEFELIEEGFDEEILEEETSFLVEEPDFEEKGIRVFEEEEEEDLVEKFEIMESAEEILMEEEQENEVQENEIDDEVKILDTEIENSEEAEAFENNKKKIKLSNIKGLKNMSSLFEDDFFEEEKQEKNAEQIIEASSSKSDFKLDLNDKLAFSKILFGGSQLELNEVVRNLNSFDNLDDAKQYLSDMYYEKGWDKVDEYAQRLWVLVENKFL